MLFTASLRPAPKPSRKRVSLAAPTRAATLGMVLMLAGTLTPASAEAQAAPAARQASPSPAAGPSTVPAGQAARGVATHLTRLPIPAVAARASRAMSSSGAPVVAGITKMGLPFDVAGVTFVGKAPDDLGVEMRTRTARGWSRWLSVDLDSEDGPDPGSSEARRQTTGSAVVTSAGADGVEVRVSTRHAVPEGLALTIVDGGSAPGDGAMAPPASAASGSIASGVDADPAVAPAAGRTLSATTAVSVASVVPAPAIVTRAQWGADERLMPCQPDSLAGFKAAVVHHTVNANDYTAAQAPGLVRGIFAFHTQSRGWCDIGYNFLVDRFGRVYEGRKGSISGFTMGAQAGGFNQETFGVSVIGDFSSVSFPSAVRTSVAKVIAWQADRNAFDPGSSVTLTSGGSTRYDAGVRVTKPRVVGHRDLSLTSCPGDGAYPQVAGIRSSASSQWRAAQYVGRAGKYTPVSARRFLDTRSGLGAPRTPLKPGGVITIRPAGLPSDVTAVTVNLTATGATANTALSAVPAGSVVRQASVLNTGPGRTTAAAVTVGVGAGGAITLRNTSGSIQLIGDLAGYYSTGSSAGLVGSFRRVLDTRSGLGAPAQHVAPNRPVTLKLTGLPAGTRAVNLNLVATRTERDGFLTAYAGGSRRPATSNLNYRPGQDVANVATVPVGSGGTVTIYASATTDVVADIEGIFVSGSGSRFTPLSPRRVLDTRYGWSAPYGQLGSGRTLAVTVAGVPVGASGVALSLAATGAARPTVLTVYPAGASRPGTSNLNVTPGQAVSGLVVSGIRASGISISNAGGATSVVADLLGYYGS